MTLYAFILHQCFLILIVNIDFLQCHYTLKSACIARAYSRACVVIIDLCPVEVRVLFRVRQSLELTDEKRV